MTAIRLEPIWNEARQQGVLILPKADWRGGAWYIGEPRPIVLLPAELSLREERWFIAHELGHHRFPALMGNPDWLAEARADRHGVETLLRLYDVDQVAWPERVWHLLPHWEDVAA